MAEKRFYWLKLKRDFFKRHDIRIIESMNNGKDYILFYLKLLCESIDHEGRLRFSESVPYNEQMLAVITDTNVDIVRSAVKIFTDLKMMELMDDGTYFMSEVTKMTGSAVDNDNANRQRRFREQRREMLTDGKALQNVTETVTKNNESKRKSKSKSTEKDTSYLKEEDEEDYIITSRRAAIESAWKDEFGRKATPAIVKRLLKVLERNAIDDATLKDCITRTARREANDPANYLETLIMEEAERDRKRAAATP